MVVAEVQWCTGLERCDDESVKMGKVNDEMQML